MSGDYGLFVWPSAVILSDFIIAHANLFKGKHILELGSGTGLSGLIAAVVGASSVTLTDAAHATAVLQNCLLNVQLNAHLFRECNVKVRGLSWGVFSGDVLFGMCDPPPDIIIAADCFYDSEDFDHVLATVAFFLRTNPAAVLYTTYHHRSANRCIMTLLKKWNLKARAIPLDSFVNSSKNQAENENENESENDNENGKENEHDNESGNAIKQARQISMKRDMNEAIVDAQIEMIELSIDDSS
jgi:predicted nicotinamide N-methyase